MLSRSTKLKAMFHRMGFWNTVGYVVFTVVLERVGVHVNYIFRMRVSGDPVSFPGFDIEHVCRAEEMGDQDWIALREYGLSKLVEEFKRAFASGKTCMVLRRVDGRLACVCWMQKMATFAPGDEPCILVSRCFTLPEFRGKGLYPAALQSAGSGMTGEPSGPEHVMIECSKFNYASRRGIMKAGFQLCGVSIELGRWKKVWARPGA